MEFSQDFENDAFIAQAAQRAQTANFLRTLAADPVGAQHLAATISQWGDAAPTLPAGAIYGLASSGITPDHPVGQQVIKNGLSVVPSMSQYQMRVATTMNPQPQNNPSDVAPGFAGGPPLAGEPQSSGGFLHDVGHVASDVGGFLNRDVGRPVGALIDKGQNLNTQTALGTPGATSGTQTEQASTLTPTEALKGATRTAGAITNSAFQVVKEPLEITGSAVSTLRGNPEGETVSGPFGTHYHFGSLKQAVSPEQLQIVQAVQGKSLGQGILPGGAAVAAATKAQQAAGNINGHALTYGRALASAVASPDTRVFHVVSGVTDFGVAQELDPTAWLAKSLSDSTEASHIFSETTDASRAAVADELISGATDPDQIAGLENWATNGESTMDLRGAVIDRMRTDPAGMAAVAQRLGIADPKDLMRAAKAPQTGVFVGLRPFVHRQSVLSYLVSEQGTKDATELAKTNSFLDLRDKMGRDVPVDTIAHVQDAQTPEDVKFLINDELGTSIAGPGTKAIRPWQNTRLAAMLPDRFADLTDNQQAVETAERTMASANVSRAAQDPILHDLALASNQGDAYNIYVNRMGGAIADKLAQDDRIGGIVSAPGIPVEEAKKLTTFYADQSAEQHLYNVNESGQNARVTVGTVADEPIPLSGPHLETEMGRFVPSLDPIALRQATTKWRQAIHLWHDGYVTDTEGFAGNASRVAHQAARAERYVMGAITGVWKTGVLATLRLPVRIGAEGQAAASVAGVDSMWTNPASVLSLIAGAKEGKLQDFLDRLPGVNAKGSADALGNEWASMLGDRQSAYSQWLGRAAGQVPSPWSMEQQILKRYTLYDKSLPSEYRRGWIDEISHLHLDPVSRETARALLDPENYSPAGVTGHSGLDAVKDWVKNGPGAEYLNNLESSHSEDSNSYIEALHSGRMTPDEWVDSIADRVKTKTASDPKLLNAVGYNKDPETGDTPFDFSRVNQGYKKSTSQEFQNYIKANVVGGPEKVRALTAVKNTGREAGLISWFGDRMMGAVMDSPSKLITRSPAGRQFYYQEIQRMFGQLTPEAQTQALSQATEDGWKLTKTAGTGAADLEHVDLVAKARTLSKLHDYLYYPGEQNTAESMLRNLVPFAGAWHSALRRWSKLAIEHPQIVRRTQQGVQELQSSGVFYKDPQNGNRETMGIFGPGIMRELTGAVGFNMGGPVQNANILGGLPGAGLGAQISAEALLPKMPATDWLRSKISPYGSPDFTGGYQMFLPGWLQKMSAAQFQPLRNVPVVGDTVAHALSYVIPRTDSQKTAVQDLAKQAFATMANSGAYNLSNPDVFNQVTDKAMQQAESLYFWRGLAQMVLPTAPTYSASITPKNGTAAGTSIMLYKIGADFRKMQAASGGDYQKADLQLVQKYGVNAIYATAPENLRTIYGVPTTLQGEVWQQQHQGFVQKYGNVWGYFAPQGGGFNQTVYHDQLSNGLIQPLNVNQWAREANQQIGSIIYDTLRTKAGVSPDTDTRAWLAQNKKQLMKDYPGYNTTIAGVAGKPYSVEKIAQITEAVNDPTVARTPLATAARLYLDMRQQALDKAGVKSFKAQAAAPYKEWLYENGSRLATASPAFANIWDGLFLSEVAPDG